MKSHSLPFVDIDAAQEERKKLTEVLETIHPRFVRWMRSISIRDNQVRMVYNINTPTIHWLKKEIEPLLCEHGLPTTVEATYQRPGELHPDAREFLEELKKRADDDLEITELAWLAEEDRPALFYLYQYQFVSLEHEQEVLGFDENYSTLWCRSWITRIKIIEADGEKLLKRWMEEK